MSIPVMDAYSGAFRSIPVRSGPFLLLYAPIKSVYDQEMPQSHTTDQPMAIAP